MGQNATSSRDQLNKTFESATRSLAIVPSDVATGANDQVFHSLWIGGVGNVAVVHDDGSVGNYLAVPAGTKLTVSGKRVNATGTTATNIVGMLW